MCCFISIFINTELWFDQGTVANIKDATLEVTFETQEVFVVLLNFSWVDCPCSTLPTQHKAILRLFVDLDSLEIFGQQNLLDHMVLLYMNNKSGEVIDCLMAIARVYTSIV